MTFFRQKLQKFWKFTPNGIFDLKCPYLFWFQFLEKKYDEKIAVFENWENFEREKSKNFRRKLHIKLFI